MHVCYATHRAECAWYTSGDKSWKKLSLIQKISIRDTCWRPPLVLLDFVFCVLSVPSYLWIVVLSLDSEIGTNVTLETTLHTICVETETREPRRVAKHVSAAPNRAIKPISLSRDRATIQRQAGTERTQKTKYNILGSQMHHIQQIHQVDIIHLKEQTGV